MKNKSIENHKQWTDGSLTFTEVICQEYQNCKFSAGHVDGHPVDTLFLQAEKDGRVTTKLLLRPDEMAAIAWISTGAMWSTFMKDQSSV